MAKPVTCRQLRYDNPLHQQCVLRIGGRMHFFGTSDLVLFIDAWFSFSAGHWVSLKVLSNLTEHFLNRLRSSQYW